MSHVNTSCLICRGRNVDQSPWDAKKFVGHVNTYCLMWMIHSDNLSISSEVMYHIQRRNCNWVILRRKTVRGWCKWGRSHVNWSCLICRAQCKLRHPEAQRRSYVILWSDVSHGWISVSAHVNESWLIWMSHGSYEWVMSHMSASCLICRAQCKIMILANKSCLILWDLICGRNWNSVTLRRHEVVCDVNE